MLHPLPRCVPLLHNDNQRRQPRRRWEEWKWNYRFFFCRESSFHTHQLECVDRITFSATFPVPICTEYNNNCGLLSWLSSVDCSWTLSLVVATWYDTSSLACWRNYLHLGSANWGVHKVRKLWLKLWSLIALRLQLPYVFSLLLSSCHFFILWNCSTRVKLILYEFVFLIRIISLAVELWITKRPFSWDDLRFPYFC